MGYCRKIFIITLCIIQFNLPTSKALDAERDGAVYGDPEGLARVEKLEAQIHNMEIIKEHPRIFLCPENLDLIRNRSKEKMHKISSFNKILGFAEKGDIVNLAFAYLMLEESSPRSANECARKVIQALIEADPLSGDKRFISQEVGRMALAFDWTYNAMSEDQRRVITDKLSRLAKIDEKAKKIRNGYKRSGEVFHREEWMFKSYKAWPEIALAHHNPNADFIYKARWRYDWYWGDAARMYAYAADGTPFEGYYYGADGVDWFLALKSATGINLIDGEFGWCKNAAYHILYRLDLERGREIFHHGVCLGAAGCVSYKEGSVAWKIREFFGRTLALASDNPYIKWVLNKNIGISSWILTTIGYRGMKGLGAIARILFDDPTDGVKDLRDASYDNLPLARLFPGGNEAYMRTGWFGKPTCVGFRSSPAYTKTSHGDFDVNTFVIYKDGVLSPDSGVYDAYAGQKSYFQYQKNTTAHNNLIVIDPKRPDGPIKLSGATDPGGTERVFTRSFGAPSRFGIKDVFLHNENADWADIIDFKTTPTYDYVIGEAAKAYSSRVDEFIRSLAFIRKGSSAYVIIFDRVEAKSPKFIKKSLIHLVGEPKVEGKLLDTKVEGHYEIFDSNFFESENAFGTSRLFCKMLLPYKRSVAKIGGDGYEFYVEGKRPKNYSITEKTIKRVEKQMGGVWQEIGRWRLEIIPEKKQKRDYFLQVMYVTETDDTFNPEDVTLEEKDESFVVSIKDDLLSNVRIEFAKTGKPGVDVTFQQLVEGEAL